MLLPSCTRRSERDEDGDDDLVANGHDGLSLRINRGEGVFDSPVQWSYSNRVSDLAIIDLDRDGDLDAVAADITLGVGIHAALNSCPELCSGADFVLPHGVQDLGDITTFADYFLAANPIADITRDDLIDLGDISMFVSQFNTDCPGSGND